MVGADRCPAMSNRVRGLALFDNERIVEPTIRSKEGIPLRVEAVQVFRACKISEVIAAFTIFSLVIDDSILNLDFTNIEIALEIGGIVLGIPQAEFNE